MRNNLSENGKYQMKGRSFKGQRKHTCHENTNSILQPYKQSLFRSQRPTDKIISTNENANKSIQLKRRNSDKLNQMLNKKLSFFKDNYCAQISKEPNQNIRGDINQKAKNIIEITSTSCTMRDVNNGQANFKKTIFLKNRRKNPKWRNSVITDKKFHKNDFNVIKMLGNGKYGKVYLVKEKQTGYLLAMKIVDKAKIIQQNLMDQFIRELKIQSYLNHPNIIKFFGFFDDQDSFYMLMQLGSDGQLYDYLQNGHTFSQQSTSFISKSLLDAVSYMHSEKILHRDIKPENIVLIMGNVKLCDFGWAVVNDTEMRNTFCGTPLYFSPQLLQGEMYNQKVDIWAIGVLAYQLITGVSPFNLKTAVDLPNIVKNEIVFPKNMDLSEQFKEFINSILIKNPNQRLEGRKLLKLPFITDYNEIQTCEELCSTNFR